jgi:ribosome maturation factor RimP
MLLDEGLLENINKQIKSIVESSGLDLIELKVFPKGNSWVIRSIVDYASSGVTVNECASLNRSIASWIEKSNIFGNDFIVEVNSPGLDRPLREAKDFMRDKNRYIRIWLKESLKGTTYIEGKLLDVKERSILLKVKEGILDIPFDIINKALQKIDTRKAHSRSLIGKH